MNIEAALSRAREWAEHWRARQTEPDDDWPHTLLLFDARDELTLADVTDLFASEAGKQIFSDLIGPQLVRRTQAVAVATVYSCWLARVRDDGERARLDEAVRTTGRYPKDFVMPSQRPDRREILLAAAITAGGGLRCQLADVQRHAGRPPTLSAWRPPDDDIVAGRMIDPLRLALASAYSDPFRA